MSHVPHDARYTSSPDVTPCLGVTGSGERITQRFHTHKVWTLFLPLLLVLRGSWYSTVRSPCGLRATDAGRLHSTPEFCSSTHSACNTQQMSSVSTLRPCDEPPREAHRASRSPRGQLPQRLPPALAIPCLPLGVVIRTALRSRES